MHVVVSAPSGGIAGVVLRGLGIVAGLLLLAGAGLWLGAREGMGGRLRGERLARVERSPEWRDGSFHNRRPRVDGPMGQALTEFLFGGSKYRRPAGPVPVLERSAADYRVAPASGLRVTWLGHSTTLLEIDGQRVLFDPVWSDRASPLPIFGTKAFYALPLPLAQLPSVDVVLISHDHFDHLDMPTVKALAARGARFVVPLGVGAHLQAWGVPERDVAELDWWDTLRVGGLTLTATPARHFSGRSPSGQNRTLWAGWSVAGPRHRVYYSGDTALDDAMVEIGARLGPFDLTMMDVGAYDARWADVHLGPEQAVRAHRLVRGNVMLPVHWARFDLALHGWTEPVERVLVAAEAEGVRVATPRPGELFEPAAPGAPARWWPALPWHTADQAPVRSSGVAHLMGPLPAAGPQEGRQQP
jgi:L-ascorbate metabolism protein UlaG (beta-lactamase superfamily)